MKKNHSNFEGLKEMLKKDIDEGILFLIFLFLEIYLILNSKMTLAVVTFMIFTLMIIIYRKYFKKIKPITIKNKKYYEFLGKLLYLSILLSFFSNYSINLYRIIKSGKGMPVALFYPRLILLIAIVFLLLWSFYLFKKWVFKRELFFCIVSLIAIYENLILFVVYGLYEIKPSDFEIGFYLMSMFMVMFCLWMIWVDAKHEKKSEILFKK